VDWVAINNQKYRGFLVFQQALQKFNEPVGSHLSLHRHEPHGALGADG